jgi:predicted metal-dependent enzyme (double-stranded beta helix superfamily)
MKKTEPAFLQKWIEELSTTERIDAGVLRSILERNAPSPDDLSAWAQYEHDPGLSYGRSTLWSSERCGIHVMTWNPGDFTAPHGHGEADWALMYFLGDVDQRVYQVSSGQIRLQARQKIPGGSVLTPPIASFHHAMCNLGSKPFLTLHIYGSDHHRGIPTEGSRVFEIEKNRIRRSKGPAFLEMAENFYLDDSAEILACDRDTREDYYECIRPYFRRTGREERLRF